MDNATKGLIEIMPVKGMTEILRLQLLEAELDHREMQKSFGDTYDKVQRCYNLIRILRIAKQSIIVDNNTRIAKFSKDRKGSGQVQLLDNPHFIGNIESIVNVM